MEETRQFVRHELGRQCGRRRVASRRGDGHEVGREGDGDSQQEAEEHRPLGHNGEVLFPVVNLKIILLAPFALISSQNYIHKL